MNHENFTKRELIDAILQFNNPKNTSNDESKKIHEFLNKVERSKLIWIQSIEIFNEPNLELTVKNIYFR